MRLSRNCLTLLHSEIRKRVTGMSEKIMQFANFNITFGNTNAPMLEYFEDVIFPAFKSGFVRGKKEDPLRYSFSDVEIKEIDDDYVLVGNYIKDTEYQVLTTVKEGDLLNTPAQIPTAPFSRFIIFLKNHRMVLVRNEMRSPDIRSFQKTVRDMLNAYIRKANKERDKDQKFPIAVVHIVDIPLRDNIETVLKTVNKVSWLKLRFFPLNNDLDPMPLSQMMREDMKKVGSRTGNLVFNSPGSKEGITQVIHSTGGMAVASMRVTDNEGEIRNIKEDAFSSSSKIEYEGIISPHGDPYIVLQAKKNDAVNFTSKENLSLYERVKSQIKALMR